MRHILFAILILALGACGRGVDARLERADALMNDHPDSALAIVSAIDTAELRGERDRAEYGLLLTQARHKCDYIDTDDSLISAAARYFDDHGPDRRKMLARFYHAQVLENAGNRSAALARALPVIDIATDLGDTYWLARTHELIGDLYYDSYNMDAAINHITKSQSFFYDSGFKLNGDYKVAMLARSYGQLGRPDISVKLLDSVIPTIDSQDSVLYGFLYMSYFRPYIKLSKYRDAFKSLQLAQKYWQKRYDVLIEWCDVADAYIARNLFDSAKISLEQYRALHNNYARDPAYWSSMAKLSRSQCKYEQTANQLDSLLKYEYERAADALKDRLSFVERDYEIERKEYTVAAYRSHRQTMISFFLLFVTVTSLLTILYFYRQKRKRDSILEQMFVVIEINNSLESERKRQNEVIDKLDLSLRQAEERLETKRSLSLDMFYNSIKTMDKLSLEYFEKMSSDKLKKTILTDFTNEINRMKQDVFFEQIADSINKCMDNIVERIKIQIPDLSQNDIHFLVLLLAGFSPRSICLLTNLKIGSYYNKVSRLKNRIQSSGAPNLNDFLIFVSK